MIGILTCSHKRPDIDEAYCLMIDRFMNDFPGIFTAIAVVSLEEDKKTFEKHNIETHLYRNEPLGEKHNFLFSKAKGRFSNVIYIGSDDIIDNNYMNELLKNKDKDIAWGRGLTFYSVQHRRARFWDAPYRNAAGPAKIISSKVLDNIGWVAYYPINNNNLDHKSFEIMSSFIETKEIFEVKKINGLLMDIKSHININGFNQFINNGKEMDLNYIYSKLPKNEVDYLKSLN